MIAHDSHEPNKLSQKTFIPEQRSGAFRLVLQI
jgi:hypothetical protein